MNIKDRVVSKQRFFAHLRALAASKKTGTLMVTEPGVERRLYFEEGAVVVATSTLPEESMGYLLAERDIVKAHKVKQADDLMGGKASLLGRKLVELGALSEDEVGNAVRLKVKETISNILASPEAEVTINDETFPDVDRVPVSIDIDQLLSAGIEAAERKVLPRDTEETLAVSKRQETIAPAAEPEPQETLGLLEEEEDEDDPLMEALEGFTEKFSRDAASASRAVGPVTKPYAVVPEPRSTSARESSGTSGLPAGIIAAAVVGLVLLGGGYWLFTSSPEPSAASVAEPAGAPSTTNPAVPSEPPGDSSDGADVSSDTAERPAPDVSASLSPRAAPRASTPANPAPPPVNQPVRRPVAAPTAPANPTPVRPEPEPEAAPSPPVTRSEPSPALSANANPEPPAPAVPSAPPEPAQPAQQAQAAQQGAPDNWGSAVFAPKQATVSSAPSNPAVQTGDLVEPGFDVIEPVLIEHPKLKYPNEAKRQKIREAVVRVRVLVDHTGVVQDAQLEKGAGHGFDEVALAAALQARFIPATKDRVHVKTWTVLPLVFRLD